MAKAQIKLLRVARHYYLFSIALVGTIIAIVLRLMGQHTASDILLIGIAIGELIPLLVGMARDLRDGKYGVDILAATAIITALIMGEYWAGIIIVLMLTGGKALEDYAEHRAQDELEALLKRAPLTAIVLRGRKEQTVRARDVRVGDKIIIRAGDLVPVDATILEGNASFDESSLTGESLPQPKEQGDALLSGSVNIDGAIVARALHSAADSQYEQIIKLVKSARTAQAPFVRLADRYAVPFTLVAFGIAIAAWLVSGESIRFLEVLVVATPCPLILAAPIAIISGMSRNARHGIIVKNGGALERLAEARTFAFDKTGTLTKGVLVVDQIETISPYKTNEVLGLAASLEQHSSHSQAKAIVDYANKQGVKYSKTKHVRELAGLGISSVVGGRHVIVGRLSLLEQENVHIPKGNKILGVRNSAAFVAIDGHLAGVIVLADELRSESQSTLNQLRSLGVQKFLMITGDTKTVAARIGAKLGIQQIIAGALPGDKLRAIEAIKERPVAFVGDGVNDAPVLTAIDVGIALGAKGSAAASESADIVIMLDDLSRVGRAMSVAKHTFKIARQSILIGIGLSVGLMLIYATGRFSPVSGALIQEVVDIIVIFNALRAHSDSGDGAEN